MTTGYTSYKDIFDKIYIEVTNLKWHKEEGSLIQCGNISSKLKMVEKQEQNVYDAIL